MTKDEALTLEALKYAASKGYGRIVREMNIAPFTIKYDEALAQPVQEATAFIAAEERKREERYGYFPKLHPSEYMDEPEERNFCPRCGKRTADLTTIHTCTPPPAPRPWVGLTDDDLLQIRESLQTVEGQSLLRSLTKAIEAKLKEKNT